MAKKESIMNFMAAVTAPDQAPVVAMPTIFDQGADGPANRDGLVEEKRPFRDPESGKTINPNGIKGVRRPPWILRYLKQDKITVRQYMAALSLSDTAAGFGSQDTLAALGLPKAGGRSDPQVARVDARVQFRKLWALVPPASRPIIERVVLNDEAVWTGGGKTRQRHMERLATGLNAIADATG